MAAREQNGLEDQWRHPRIRKIATPLCDRSRSCPPVTLLSRSCPPVLYRLRKPVAYIKKAIAQTKQAGNKLSIQEMLVKTLPLQWCSKKLWIFLIGSQTEQYQKIWGCFKGWSRFFDSRYLPQHPPKFQKRSFRVSYTIPQNFKTKNWQENFICEEN